MNYFGDLLRQCRASWAVLLLLTSFVWASLPCASATATELRASSPQQSIELSTVEVLDSHYQEFSVGERFILNLDRSELEAEGGAHALRFRVFAGLRSELESGKAFEAKDGCLIYSSKSYKAHEANGGVHFDLIFGIDWLMERGTGQLHDGFYVLVIERKNDTGDFLRLHKDHVGSYFRRGFSFIVRAPREEINEGIASRVIAGKRRRAGEVGRRIETVASQTRADSECRTFVHVLVARRNEFEPTLVACRSKSALRWPRGS